METAYGPWCIGHTVEAIIKTQPDETLSRKLLASIFNPYPYTALGVMKFPVGAAFALGFGCLLDKIAAEPAPIVVDRLVSERYLQKRDAGYANGGNQFNSGKDKFGNPKNWLDYEMSFYHINDVHAYVSSPMASGWDCDIFCFSHLDEFRSSGSSCTDVTKGQLEFFYWSCADIESYLGCVGGYSRVKNVIDKNRPTKKNSLFLNAGDEFQVNIPHLFSCILLTLINRGPSSTPYSKGRKSLKLSTNSALML